MVLRLPGMTGAMAGRGWRLLAPAAALVLGAGLLFGLLVPVYSDEVVWRFSERAALDGFDKLGNDTCGPNTLAVPPWFMWPVRFYSAFFNTHFAAPIWVRLSGVVYALGIALLLWRLAGAEKSTQPGEGALHALHAPGVAARAGLRRGWVLGLLALGAMPLLLVWSRPEQPILLALLVALRIAFGPHVAAGPAGRDGWRTLGRLGLAIVAIIACAVVAFSYHMKGTLLAPVFGLAVLAVGHHDARGHHAGDWRGRALRWGGVAVVAALGLTAMHYWVARFSCPMNPAFARTLATQNIAAMLTDGRSPLDAVRVLLSNPGLLAYMRLATPAVHPMADWLLPGAVSPWQMHVWQAALYVAWVPSVVAAMALWSAGAWARWRRAPGAGGGWRALLAPRLWFAPGMLALIEVWGLTQTSKNVYDASFVLPLLAVVLVLAAGEGAGALGAAWCGRLARWGVAAVIGAAAVSLVALATTYTPSLLRSARAVAWIPGQPYSQALFGWAEARPRIVALGRLCGIAPDGVAADGRRQRALVVDDVTYFAEMGSFRPQHQISVMGTWHGGVPDPLAYLRQVRSDGAILGCGYVPAGLRRFALRSGDVCCIPKATWMGGAGAGVLPKGQVDVKW